MIVYQKRERGSTTKTRRIQSLLMERREEKAVPFLPFLILEKPSCFFLGVLRAFVVRFLPLLRRTVLRNRGDPGINIILVHDCIVTALAGADADHLLHRVDEDEAVTDVART